MSKTLIGHCGVDSGQIMIVDPCYVIDNKFSEGEYDECCEVTCGDDRAGGILRGLAVVSSSGIGDGNYPVYATIEEVPGWGERVTSLTIDFKDHILIDEEEECQRCGNALEGSDSEYCWRCEEVADEEDDDDD